jgi:hypothetical protein
MQATCIRGPMGTLTESPGLSHAILGQWLQHIAHTARLGASGCFDTRVWDSGGVVTYRVGLAHHDPVYIGLGLPVPYQEQAQRY